MKKIILIVLVVISTKSLYAQHAIDLNSMQPSSSPPRVTVPKFVDSLQLLKDFRQLTLLNDMFQNFKNDSATIAFSYSFEIDLRGRVKLLRPENVEELKPLNNYVETTFVNYKWQPSNRIRCKSCLVKTHGVLWFIFDTENGYITCMLEILNEKSYRIFSENIMME